MQTALCALAGLLTWCMPRRVWQQGGWWTKIYSVQRTGFQEMRRSDLIGQDWRWLWSHLHTHPCYISTAPEAYLHPVHQNAKNNWPHLLEASSAVMVMLHLHQTIGPIISFSDLKAILAPWWRTTFMGVWVKAECSNVAVTPGKASIHQVEKRLVREIRQDT